MTAIYCRQSVDKKDSISIAQQEAACRRCLPEETVTVYADKGFTGANTRRPDFERLMMAVESGAVSRVIVYKVDRISRSLQDFVGIYRTFERYGVELLSCSEQFDTATAMGKATLQMIMVFAELERNMIVKRVRDNFYERARKGLFLSGVAPYGFEKQDTVLEGVRTKMLAPEKAHPEKTQAVIGLFQDYLVTGSLGKLARKMNERGLRTNRGKLFSSPGVARILRNPVYVRADASVYRYLKQKGAIFQDPPEAFSGVRGCTVFGSGKNETAGKFSSLSGKTVQLNRHEGLIDSHTWLQVQQLLDRNRPVCNNGRGKATWLTGLCRCGFCGRAVSVVRGRGGRRYLTCGGRKASICHKRTAAITAESIEELVSLSLRQHLADYPLTIASGMQKKEERQGTMQLQLVRTEEEIAALMEKAAAMDGVLLDYLRRRIEELDRCKKQCLRELTELEAPCTNKGEEGALRRKLLSFDSCSREEQAVIAGIFLERVVVYEDALEIYFR